MSCGTKHSTKLTRRLGISAKERDAIEGTLKTSFGLKGIAELKSELKSKISHEIGWDKSEEIEEEFEWEAPKCGRETIALYQLQRVYKLSFEDTRFWHKDAWTRTVVEWLERIADQSKRVENDPDCGCSRQPKVGGDGLVNLSLGKISMVVPFTQHGNHIEFSTLKLSVRARDVEQLFEKTYTIDRRCVPDYLLFLAGAKAKTFEGQFARYVEPTPQEVFHESEQQPRSAMGKFLYLLAGAALGAVAGSLLGSLSDVDDVSMGRAPQRSGLKRAGEVSATLRDEFRAAYESGRRSAAQEQSSKTL
jgi:hypothetical protein